jgi:isopropylmalate/homocitrate/citramalate synthase
MKPSLPKQVHIVEVGPRDGLQNEAAIVPSETKAAFIVKLAEAGLTQIEVTSFVHPRVVPQLADAEAVVAQLPRIPGVVFSALVPNQRGLERAVSAGIKRVAVFTGATETFTRKNIQMGVEESLEAFKPLIAEAAARGMTVRGYLSVCFVCPYEGRVNKQVVRDLTQRLLDLGVNQVAISDTIGAAVPTDVWETVGFVLESVPSDLIALHFHDTWGTALANVCAGLQLSVETFDASAGGLGGCPFAPGAAGNLATEDLVSMLHGMGIDTGVHLEKLAAASDVLASTIGRELPSRVRQRFRAHPH